MPQRRVAVMVNFCITRSKSRSSRAWKNGAEVFDPQKKKHQSLTKEASLFLLEENIVIFFNMFHVLKVNESDLMHLPRAISHEFDFPLQGSGLDAPLPLCTFRVEVALLANWMGPPNRANLPVFS